MKITEEDDRTFQTLMDKLFYQCDLNADEMNAFLGWFIIKNGLIKKLKKYIDDQLEEM